MNMELRMHEAELRSNDDGTMTVSGYVNKTNHLSEVLGATKRFREKIQPGAFSEAIKTAQRGIDFLAEHNRQLILASTRNGSLDLREDGQGLFMSATITPTSWGKDYYQLINDGILQNMSFGFRTLKDSWSSISPGLYERTIESLELFEVSVVRDPAYSQSTIAARGINLVEDVEIPAELEEETRKMEEKLTEILEELRSTKEQVEALTAELRELRAAAPAPSQDPEPDDKEADKQDANKADDKAPLKNEKVAGAKDKKKEKREDSPEKEAEEDQEEQQDKEEDDDPEVENPDGKDKDPANHASATDPEPGDGDEEDPEDEEKEDNERSAEAITEDSELRNRLLKYKLGGYSL